jgi:dihydroxyacetone kinase-like predicted kinase
VGQNKFCTEFVVQNATVSVPELRRLLEPRGESLLVVGAEPTIKVHVHTDNPERVQEIAARCGDVTRVKVDDMERQHTVLVVEKPKRGHSVVALVPGDGFARIARELGAEVVVSNAKNPSVRDVLLAVNKCMSDDVYVFVNDKNVVLAANEVKRLTDKAVHVIPTPDIVSGIAGLFAFGAAAAAEVRNPDDESLLAAAKRPRSAQVFFAGKDATVGGVAVAKGKPAAVYDGRMLAAESPAEAVRSALTAMDAAGGGLITLYYGGAQKERDAQRLSEEVKAAFPDAAVEYYYGGMKNAEYWLSVDE